MLLAKMVNSAIGTNDQYGCEKPALNCLWWQTYRKVYCEHTIIERALLYDLVHSKHNFMLSLLTEVGLKQQKHGQLVRWCFEPSQPLGIISGLEMT